MNYNELEKYTKLINYVMGENNISAHIQNDTATDTFYKNTNYLYRKVHSPEGAMHFPVEFSKKDRHKKKLLYQADSIHDLIQKHNYTNILELGCGMGFNSHYLAKKNPELKFTAVDLTGSNINIARSRAKKIGASNTSFVQHNFDTFEIEEGKYDLIFGIETLCYSQDIASLVQKMGKGLKANGRIIIFDGYERGDKPTLDETEAYAYRLACWGFVLEKYQNINEILESDKLSFLEIEENKDYSMNILPNYLALQKGGKNALRYALILKILLKLKIIPSDIIKQIAGGMFSAYFVSTGYLKYYKLVFTKK